MKELVAEGFLSPPSSPRMGYTLAWDEEQVQNYLENHPAELKDTIN